MRPQNPYATRDFTETAGSARGPIFPYKEEVGGSSPSTPTTESLAL